MSTPFLGQVILFAGMRAPKNWAFCNGQVLQITDSPALFSLLGTNYGGDGISTFGLPDFQGRAPISAGQGAGLSAYSIGEKVGVETVSLIRLQSPAHTHSLNAVASGTVSNPSGAYWAGDSSGTLNIYSSGPTNTPLSSQALNFVGGGQPHENRPPGLVINYIISLNGSFPTRP